GYDASRIGISYEELRRATRYPELSDVAGRRVTTHRLDNVVVALRRTNGKPVLQFLNHVDVLEPEQGMTDDNHIPSLLGVDVLSSMYALKPRLRNCYFEK